jgi:hypothetical protein
MDLSVNYLAVLVAAAAALAIGALWYSPILFARRRTPGSDMASGRAPAASYALLFVCALLMSLVLAHFAALFGARGMAGGLQLGFWSWLGFAAPAVFGSSLGEGRSLRRSAVNSGYHLIALLVMAAILAGWR